MQIVCFPTEVLSVCVCYWANVIAHSRHSPLAKFEKLQMLWSAPWKPASAKCLKCRWRDCVCSMMDEARGETQTDRYRRSEPGEGWTRRSHRGTRDRQTASPCSAALMTGSKLILQDKQIAATNLVCHHTLTHTNTAPCWKTCNSAGVFNYIRKLEGLSISRHPLRGQRVVMKE